MKLKIKGVSWHVKLVSERHWKRTEDAESFAITDTAKYQILFRKDYLSKGIVLHELLHAYVKCCSLESVTDLSSSAMEEICAGILQDHGEEMFLTATKLYSKLNKK